MRVRPPGPHFGPSENSLELQPQSHLMPFGTGQRICGGMNLAHIMLRVALVAIVRNFDIVAPPETTPESMGQRFAFVRLGYYRSPLIPATKR